MCRAFLLYLLSVKVMFYYESCEQSLNSCFCFHGYVSYYVWCNLSSVCFRVPTKRRPGSCAGTSRTVTAVSVSFRCFSIAFYQVSYDDKILVTIRMIIVHVLSEVLALFTVCAECGFLC